MKIERTYWNGLGAVVMETPVYEAMVIPSVGANLVRLYNKKERVDFLRTPQSDEIRAFKERPQIFGLPLLFPPNRIADGVYSHAGRTYSFPITIPAQNNYHHGIIKSQEFIVSKTEVTDSGLLLEATFISNSFNHEIYDNFPHSFVCTMRFVLTDDGMEHTVLIHYTGSSEMPLGLGYHTPLRLPFCSESSRADYKLHLSVGKRWELSERGLPTGTLLDLTSEEQLLRSGGLNPTGQPIEWALTAEPMLVDGKMYNGAILEDKKSGIRLFYEVDDQFKHWTLWNNGGEVDWVCPEPQTWAINAPNLGLPDEITGFQALQPGQRWSAVSKFYLR